MNLNVILHLHKAKNWSKNVNKTVSTPPRPFYLFFFLTLVLKGFNQKVTLEYSKILVQKIFVLNNLYVSLRTASNIKVRLLYSQKTLNMGLL